ncbi:MAG: hypothetical protein R3E75_08175 [Steroidobacteraceae bacterium]|nr:hypothetical protein [Nevskiaceae bacterium]MCP5472290.1 hypothetical protein [Nevskiaceae bacterium]
MSEESQSQIGELSAEVFEKFLAELEQAGIPEEVRGRLRQTLLIDPKFSDAALRTAVFGEESSQ